MSSCCACAETEDLVQCKVCQKLVCSRHRAGTESLSDGYACAGTGSGCWMGLYVGEELRTVPKSSTTVKSSIAPGTPLNWAVIIAIVVASLASFLIGHFM